MREEFKNLFTRVANAGRNLSIVPKRKEQIDPALARLENIRDWCRSEAHPGYLDLIDELKDRITVARDSQRIRLESHPEVSYGMGMEDGLQQVLDLLATGKESED